MSSSFTPKSTGEEVATALKDSIKGKNVLLVGASVGSLGGEFLRVIAPYAKTIWVAGRSKERLQTAVDAALKDLPAGASEPIIHIVELDATSFESIRAAAASINAQEQPIDVLFGNVMVPQKHELELSADGYEVQFAGNHLSTFLLVSLLLPRLRRAGPGSRVVQVSSLAHRWSPTRWEDPAYKLHPEEYRIGDAYGWSKIANILFIKELAKRGAKDGILAYTLHPGIIITKGVAAQPRDYMDSLGAVDADGNLKKDIFSKGIPEGVATYVAAAFDPSIKDQSGAYLDDSVVHNDRVSPEITEEAASRMWTLTEELVGVKLL